MRPVLTLLSPDWLKYGYPGLVAIFALLLYFIFKPIINQDTANRRLWVLLFIAVSLLLLGTGGLYIYTADNRNYSAAKTTNTYKRNLDSLHAIISSQSSKLDIYTHRTPQNDSLVKLIRQQQHEHDSLTTKIAVYHRTISYQKRSYDSLTGVSDAYHQRVRKQQQLITNLVIQDIQESLEEDLSATSGKASLSGKIPDLGYKRLKRAVFLNFPSFNADKTILRGVFASLVKQSTEFSQRDTDRVLAEYTALMRLRLQWLKEQAIPALQADITRLREQPQIQEEVHASVKFPEEVIILAVDDAHGGNYSYVKDMQTLKREQDMLVAQLTK